ncbi:MAG TPA: hypothetical protein EYG98_05630 [Sulfurovum sp.]|nr:hypothetical protein [Sulfurovum sp.]
MESGLFPAGTSPAGVSPAGLLPADGLEPPPQLIKSREIKRIEIHFIRVDFELSIKILSFNVLIDANIKIVRK